MQSRTQQTEIDGFLLSRQWFDKADFYVSTADKKNLSLIFWFASDQGPCRVIFDQQMAVFFVESRDAESAQSTLSRLSRFGKQHWYTKRVKLKSFGHQNVLAFYFSQQKFLYIARDELLKNSIVPLEADIHPTARFLMERFVTGGARLSGTTENMGKFQQFLNPKILGQTCYPDLKILSLDIETSMQGEKLFSIAAYANTHSKNIQESTAESAVFMIGEEVSNNLTYLYFCKDEIDLLNQFLHWFHEFDPDIVIGWNVINFDLRFLQRKADAIRVKFALGRDHMPIEWRQSRDDDQFYTLVIPGRAVLDGIDTLKSATYNFESFSLEYVASVLLNRGKLIHNVDNRGEEITRLFNHDKPALAEYNLEDCRLVWEIFCQAQLINFALERANMTGLALDRFGGSVAAFDNCYLPRLHRLGYVAPALRVNPPGVGSPGGYVMESAPGLYQNVLVLDFKSLYPSIIRTFKIDPLALVMGVSDSATQAEQLAQETLNVDRKQRVPGFNGAVFDKNTSLLPDIIGELWLARDRAKQERNQAMSQAIKILMNSFYGVLGTPGCRFFDSRLPSSITLRGHQILNQTKVLVENKGYKVIYGDTDSLFVWLKASAKDFDVKQLFQLGNELTHYLNAWWRCNLRDDYGLISYLELEFETCFNRFVMPTVRGADTGSKKRYAGKRVQAETDVEDDIVFKGLEAVRTDWTQLAREFQKELYRRIFCDEPYEAFIQQTVEDVYAGKCDDKLIYRKRIRRRLDDYHRNIPPHVHAARLAEEALNQSGKPSRYARGGWIQYLMTVAGPEPLEYRKSSLDYDLYTERQLAPIVDGIVQFMGTSFEKIAGRQLGLF